MATKTRTSSRRTNSGKYSPDVIKPSTNGEAEKTGDQSANLLCNSMSMLAASGGSWSRNPCAFPGYGSLYTGTYATYRWMLQHPVIQLVRAICTAEILASSWEYQQNFEVVPTEWTDLVKATFNRIRQPLLENFFIRGRDYGYAPGEIIWQYNADQQIYDIDRVKPLSLDATEILADKYGNPTGLENSFVPDGSDKPSIRLAAPYKAFWYTYDSASVEGDPYGWSWLENVRETAWKQWLDCAQQLQRLGAKISGIVTVILTPSGTFKGPDGRDYEYGKEMKKIIAGFALGMAGAHIPTMTLTPTARGGMDIAKAMSQLYNKVEFKLLDFGTNAAAMAPILEEMKHAEELMFNGGKRSARTGLEAKHGTKEEAGVHTDTGTINAEVEDQGAAIAFQPLVDALLTANFGPRALGAISIKPPSLVDRKAQILKMLLASLLNQAGIRMELQDSADISSWMRILDAPMKRDYNGQNAISLEEKLGAKKGQQPGEVKSGNANPQGGTPSQRKLTKVKVSRKFRKIAA